MRRGPLLMAAGWLVAAIAATATGVAAVAVIGNSITGPTGEVISDADIQRGLASASAEPPPQTTAPTDGPTAAPSTSPSATTTKPAGNGRVLKTSAATVVAQCDGSIATLLSWTPANGYRLREVDRQRGTEAEVTFERDGQRVKVKVTCSGGIPQLRVDN